MKGKTGLLGLMACASLLTGCRLITGTVMVVFAAIGFVGYAIYKTGDVAVTGVGKIFSSSSNAVSTVLFDDGDLKTAYTQELKSVWEAADRALRKGNFTKVHGSYDVLTGDLAAQTVENAKITLKLKAVPPDATEMRIRVGEKGDLKASEFIHNMILRELAQPPTAATTPEQVAP